MKSLNIMVISVAETLSGVRRCLMSTLENVQFEESLSFDQNKKRLLFGGIRYIEVLVKVGGWGFFTVLL